MNGVIGSLGKSNRRTAAGHHNYNILISTVSGAFLDIYAHRRFFGTSRCVVVLSGECRNDELLRGLAHRTPDRFIDI